MNLRTSLCWWRTGHVTPSTRPTAPDWLNATLDAPQPDPQDAVHGCGWFDSSHELHVGVQVTEHLTPDQVANEVPLGWWLDWQSCGAGQRPLAAPLAPAG